MRVFYSHPMKRYGTAEEKTEVSQIQRRFQGWELLDPSAQPDQPPEFYLALVDTCDCLVFSRYFGYVTEGVKPEVERALAKGKQVLELRDGKFIPVTGPVANLPMKERLVLRAKGALGMGRPSS